MQVTIRELKNHLSKYLKQVQTSAEIIVTTHDKPIAHFCQLESTEEIFSLNSLGTTSHFLKKRLNNHIAPQYL